MSWMELLTDEFAAPASPSKMQSMAREWPLRSVIGVSIIGLVLAVFRSPLISTMTYVLLIVAGCGLLFYRRYDAIASTRRAGGAGVLSVQGVEKGAIAALALACLANGVVIAFEVATWPVWAHLREHLK